MMLRQQEKIIKQYQKNAPVKMVRMAHDLGLNVYKLMDLGPKVSGMIKRDSKAGGSSGFAIYVNGTHSVARRRFTIAHEIAHFILHENRIGDGIIEDALLRSNALSNPIEREANAFAADLLMPWHLIEQAEENGITGISSLADYMNVSRDAMSYRMLGLSYSEAQERGHA